jgi:hypothetical protein
MQRILFATAFTLAALAAPSAICASSPETRYEAAAKMLSSCQYCFSIRDTPEDLKALNDMWSAIEDWTVDYLNGHSQISTEDLNTALMNEHYNYTIVTAAPDWGTKLAPGLFGFGTSYNEIGVAFLVGKRDGRYRVVWDTQSLPARDVSRFPVLRAWSAEKAADGCRSDKNEGTWNRCGPIHGAFELLPRDERGNLRFFIDATYAQAAGETVAGQISVWSWDGVAAMPLLAKSYFYDFEDVRVEFAHGLLTIRAKEEYQSYYSCGACLGRRMDLAIRIAPGEVTDLGEKPLYPELDTVDSLFQAIAKRQPTESLASPRALSELNAILKSSGAEDKEGDVPELDMIDYSSVRRENGHALACISVESVDNGIVFAVGRKGGRDFITDVSLQPANPKGKC